VIENSKLPFFSDLILVRISLYFCWASQCSGCGCCTQTQLLVMIFLHDHFLPTATFVIWAIHQQTWKWDRLCCFT